MKVLPTKVEVIEVENEGFISLLGQQVEIRCNVYIYAGTLVGVNQTCVKLDNAAIVYETGAFTDAKYKDAQKIGDGQYVSMNLIESFGPCSKKY
jgi:O-phosphoseryl-tRNA(Cys) synthetase